MTYSTAMRPSLRYAGAVVVDECEDGLAHLSPVAGVHDGHARYGAHERQVLQALVGGPVLADGEAAVRADALDVQAGIGHGVADLLIGSARSEHSEGS